MSAARRPGCLGVVMGWTESAILVGTGVVAGIVSTVVSLASVVSYPILVALGLPPVTANVTNTVALVLTGVGSVAGSRPELAGQGRAVARLGIVTAVGGATGAALLLLAPERSFELAAPALVAGASALLLVQPRLARARSGRATPPRTRVVPLAGLLGSAVYIGYFGAAGGILLLVTLAGLVAGPLTRINAVKNAVAGTANLVAATGFALFGPVRWDAGLPLAAGFLVGGWLGPAIVRRIPAARFRVLVAGCGLAVAAVLAVTTY
jgi:uncharacterized membrane protein YfcA